MNQRRPAAPGRPPSAGAARRPGPSRPADDIPADVYVYRDTSGEADDLATVPGLDAEERDASYWYDLSGEDSAPVQEETRGPFEPLVSSSGPLPGGVPSPDVAPAASAAVAEGRVGRHAAPQTAEGDSDGPEDSAEARARKLAQIKDFYLTAEAIGEQNVDKHFDQLLAQQRELIGEYFKQSNAAQPGDGAAAEAGPDPEGSRPEPTSRVTIPGEQPRVW